MAPWKSSRSCTARMPGPSCSARSSPRPATGATTGVSSPGRPRRLSMPTTPCSSSAASCIPTRTTSFRGCATRPSGCAGWSSSRCRRSASASDQSCSRALPARGSGGCRCPRSAGARSSSPKPPRRIPSSPPCQHGSRGSSGTATRTTCPRKESHSRTAPLRCRRSGSATAVGVCNSIPRGRNRSSAAGSPTRAIPRRIRSRCAPRHARGSVAGTTSGAGSVARSSPRPSGSPRVPPEAFALALAAAVLHAGWNVLLRGSEDVEARTAVVLGLSILIFAPVAVATWSVSWAVAPYVAASAAFEAAYFGLLVAAYRRRELSVVYPVARGSAPVLVLLGTVGALGRQVSAGAAAGVCLVAVGVVLVRGIRRGTEGVLVALAIGCAIAAYTLVDQDGHRHAASLPYLELVLIPVALVAVPVVAVRRGTHALRAQLTASTVVAAVASFGAYALVLAALRLASAPEVAAVRETSVVLAAILAGTFLRERVGVERLAGAAAVAGGVALIALA